MKTVSLLTAMLAVTLLVGCKAKTPPPQPPPAPDPVKAELGRMTATIDQLAKDNAELRKALGAMAQKEQTKNDLSAQLDQAAKSAAALQDANARLNAALTASEAKLQQAVADFTLAGNKVQAARMDTLEAEHQALVKQNEELKTTVQSLGRNMDLDQLQTLAKLQKDLDDAQETIAAVQAQNAMLIWALQQRPDVVQQTLLYPVWMWPVRPIRNGPKTSHDTPLLPHGGGGAKDTIHPGAPVPTFDKGNGTKSGLIAVDENSPDTLPSSGGLPAGHDRGIPARDRSSNSASGGGNSGGQPVQGSNVNGGGAPSAGPSGGFKSP